MQANGKKDAVQRPTDIKKTHGGRRVSDVFRGKENSSTPWKKEKAQTKRRLYYSNHEKSFSRSMLLL